MGKAQAFLSNKLGHRVFGYDIKKVKCEFATIVKEPVVDVDINFICVNESSVEQALLAMVRDGVDGLYVIKSTTFPGTTYRLSRKYGVHICHNPEFLREKHAFRDIENPSCVVIGGCCKTHIDRLKQFYMPLKVPIIATEPTVSEVAKIVLNAYFSTQITFWNEVHELCRVFGVDTKRIADIVGLDSRVSLYGRDFFGLPFGGRCLPKDLNQLIMCFELCGTNPILFKAVKEYNERFKSTMHACVPVQEVGGKNK